MHQQAKKARRPSNCAGLRICSPPEPGMLSPGRARPAEGRASRIPGSLAWRQRSRPASGAPDARSARRRWRGAAARKAVGKWTRLPLPTKATARYRPKSASLLSRSSPPLVLCSDPGTPRGTPAQMQRKEGSQTRARKEPPRLPAIAQTPRSRAGDMPRGLRACTDQVA